MNLLTYLSRNPKTIIRHKCYKQFDRLLKEIEDELSINGEEIELSDEMEIDSYES